MKKIIIFSLALFAMSVTAVRAQQDSTLRKTDSEEANQPGVPKGYVTLQPEEIPSQLQTTLQAPEYFGWEKGSIYQNRLNSQYLILIRIPGPETRRYVFDRNGNPVTEKSTQKP